MVVRRSERTRHPRCSRCSVRPNRVGGGKTPRPAPPSESSFIDYRGESQAKDQRPRLSRGEKSPGRSRWPRAEPAGRIACSSGGGPLPVGAPSAPGKATAPRRARENSGEILRTSFRWQTKCDASGPSARRQHYGKVREVVRLTRCLVEKYLDRPAGSAAVPRSPSKLTYSWR